MKVVGLISGGKDSIYNMIECVRNNHTIIALANLLPRDVEKDDIDSWMYQTIGHGVVPAIAEAMELPLYRTTTTGSACNTSLVYTKTDNDEVEDLYRLLVQVKEAHPDIEAVASGAVLSTYQRTRVENVCARLGLISLAFLWQRDQAELLEEMIQSGMEAIIVKVAGMGLHQKHLGKTIAQLQPYLNELGNLYGCHVCGEGGEYESLTLDCPLFKKKIVIDTAELAGDLKSDIAPVAFYRILKLHTELKTNIDIKTIISKKSFKTASDSSPILNVSKKIEKERKEKKTDKVKSALCLLDDLLFHIDNDVAISDTLLHSNIKTKKSKLDRIITKINTSKKIKKISFSTSRLLPSGLCFISTVTEDDPNEQFLSFEEEVRINLSDLKKQLKLNGLTCENVFYVHFFLSDIKLFTKANSIYKEMFPLDMGNSPSRSCVELPFRFRKVSIDCMAYQKKRNVLHVQSISHWAPSCIGPYSQASQINNLLFLAGQIGLNPPTMKLIDDPQQQISKCFMNCHQVLKVLSSDLKQTINCTVFISKNIIEKDLGCTILEQTEKAFLHAPFKPLVMYVVVPCLPRNALIEVQLISYQHSFLKDDMKLQYSTKTHSKDSEEWEISENILWVQTHFCSITMELCVKFDHCITSIGLSLERKILQIVRRIQKLANTAGISLNQLYTVRIFYHYSINLHRISNEFQNGFAAEVESLSLPISVLPVISFFPIYSFNLFSSSKTEKKMEEKATILTVQVMFWHIKDENDKE